MIQNLKGKGLFVFSDPGGAKAILALVLSIKKNLTDFLIVSDRSYDFFKEFGLLVVPAENTPLTIIESFKPDFVLAGTSYTSKIELTYIIEANNQNIPCFSFVDHWTSFKQRFLINDDLIVPSKILLIDTLAKKMAIKEGFMESQIEVIGNPYYEYLKTWKPLHNKIVFFENAFGNNFTGQKLLTYVPEPLSNVGGIEKYVFDEISVFEYLIDSLKSLANDEKLKIRLVIKPHPNQNKSTLLQAIDKAVIEEPLISINFIENLNINDLMFYSDIVVGMFSNSLIEAHFLQKKVIRLMPNSKINDPLTSILPVSLIETKMEICQIVLDL